MMVEGQLGREDTPQADAVALTIDPLGRLTVTMRPIIAADAYELNVCMEVGEGRSPHQDPVSNTEGRREL